MITIIGIILALISIIGIHVGWRANEWREPLFVLMGILMRSENLKISEFYSHSRKRGADFMVFLLLLYSMGSVFIYIKNPFIWIIIIEFIVFLWLAKGVIGLIRAGYSKKIRLLNYLYSPYSFAWRRDHLSNYSDEDIAAAICEASGIDANQFSISGKTLDQFLIDLCNLTRPKHESEQYPDILKKLHEQSDGMIWLR
jgi:hypothetical protein